MANVETDWMRGSSPLKGALLGLLVQEPGHCYSLGNRLERRLGPAWKIDRRSLYRKLVGLENAGLASSDRRTDGDRNRIVYTATATATEALAEWMDTETPLEPRRVALQAKIVVARPEDVPRLLRALDSYERECFAMLGAYEDDSPQLGSLFGIGLFLARESALVHLRAELVWTDTARRAIERFMASA
jgi:DNA-binding PadR family transcriptional regulator